MDLNRLEYPRHVHRCHLDGPAHPDAWKVVADADACAAALADGWSLDCVLGSEPPPAAVEVPAEPDPPPDAEDEPLATPPKRRGRPPKEPTA